MTNKSDELGSHQPPVGAADTLDAKTKSAPDAKATLEIAGEKKTQPLSNGQTDAPMKTPNAELQARHDVIGAGLKRIFDEIVEEPIPREFLDLLDQIDRKRDQ